MNVDTKKARIYIAGLLLSLSVIGILYFAIDIVSGFKDWYEYSNVASVENAEVASVFGSTIWLIVCFGFIALFGFGRK